MTMRTRPIDSSLFTYNRHRLVQRMLPKSLAVFNANDVMPTNADGTMAFVQNADLFYFSGIDQEETILLICPESHDPKLREVLFLRETNEHIAIWEGHKYTMEEAMAASGIQQVRWLSDFPLIFNTLMCESTHVYLNTNEHLRAEVVVETRDARFIRDTQRKYPLHRYERLAPIMHDLRAVKNPIEVDMISKACALTEVGFRRVLKFLKPGVMEYEVEAEMLHEFVKNGSKGFAYGPIVASGANACVLHYVSNNQPCKEGDLLLIDAAAEYGNYKSDLTRTIPVGGRFTERQKQVYNAVLRVMRGAIAMLVPGGNLVNYHEAVGKLMEEELIGLGLLNAEEVKKQDPDKPLYKKYFMHGTSHHLGLDVHDLGFKYRPFEAGNVFTCEPGIYIREEGIGIRIENNILITNDKPIDLMQNIPIELEEIEALMNI